jgi:hypothetical protein
MVGGAVGAAARHAEAAISSGAPVAALYLGLVLLLWLPFGYKNGMPYETWFVYNSETTSFWHGFFYNDPLRVYTNIFYNLGYHLSAWLDIGGSFLGYQLVYAALWWARGFLTYLITTALFPRRRLLATLFGGLVLVHASDRALNWVGQMNQFGMIVWMLLACYALVLALKAERTAAVAAATVAAMLFARMSLWSYESPLFMILVFPLIVLIFRFGFSRRTSIVAGAFYLVPLIYIWDNYRRYTTTGSSTYQESVLRSSFSPGPMLRDLWFNVVSSLKFSSWGSGVPPVAATGERLALGIGGGALFAAGIAVVGLLLIRRGEEDLLPNRRWLGVILGSGLALLVLSFPAYLILTSSRQLWRTQFLSGIGAGVALGAAIALVASLFRRRKAQVVVVAACGGLIAYYGVAASFTMASFHYGIWQRHRTAMAEVLGVAPRLRPGTLVVLTGVPKTADPFGDNMWFDVALRLAYPHVPVTGIYFYRDGTPAPHENMALHGTSWVLDNTGFPTLLRRVPFRNTVIVRFSPSGRGSLAHAVPDYVDWLEPEAATKYAPASRIVQGSPAPAARRRYDPALGQ